jgi:quinol monooxygenase YgiN
MIRVVATVRAKPGKGPELEEDFRDWAKVVKANEPGTLEYTLYRSKDDPEVYVALELYENEAAIEAHRKNFRARQGGADVAAGPPTILLLERVA